MNKYFDKYPYIAEDIVIKHYNREDKIRLYSSKKNRLHRLNGDVFTLIKNCNGSNSVKEIERNLHECFDDVQKDVFEDTLNNLVQEGIIVFSPISSRAKVPVFYNTFNYHLDTVLLEVSAKCNYRCQYCYQDFASDDEMGFDQIKETIDDAVDNLGLLEVTLTGGEPFMREDILEIIKYIREHKIKCNILTNGSLLTKRVLDDIKTSGINIIAISIDSLNPEIYSNVTNGKNIKPVLEMLNYSLEIGLKTNINSVIMKGINDNDKEVDAFLSFMDIHKNVVFNITDVFPSGKQKNCFNLVPEADFIYSTQRKKVEKIMKLSKTSSCERASDDCNKRLFKHCRLGNEVLTITAQGYVLVCPSIRDISIGNVSRTPLSVLFKESQALEYVRNLNPHDFNKCKTCNHVTTCMGGCRSRALSHYDAIDAPDPYSCFVYNHV